MASGKQIEANRANAKKSTGPKNTESTRFNATKHGLLSAGITDLDFEEGFEELLTDLIREIRPVGILEMHRVRCIALDVVRQRRAQRMEGEFITAQLYPPQYERDDDDPLMGLMGQLIDPGTPARLTVGAVQNLVSIFQRYEATFATSISRNERALERSQRIRKGEAVPLPTAIDVNVHHQAQVQAVVDERDAMPIALISDSGSAATSSDVLSLTAASQTEGLSNSQGQSQLTASPSDTAEFGSSNKYEWRSSEPKPKPAWWT